MNGKKVRMKTLWHTSLIFYHSSIFLSEHLFIVVECKKIITKEEDIILKNKLLRKVKTTEITGTTMGAGSNTELEGLQIKDSFLYFINKDWTPGSGKYHYIYRITP